MRVWGKGIISFSVMNSAPRSDSTAYYRTNSMMVAMVETGPLDVGVGSFYERNI